MTRSLHVHGVDFALTEHPQGPSLADDGWPHLPFVVNPAVHQEAPGLDEALAQRVHYGIGPAVAVVPIAIPEPAAARRWTGVPEDAQWAEVHATFVRAEPDRLPYVAIEDLIAKLRELVAAERVPPPWLFTRRAISDDASSDEFASMKELEAAVQSVVGIDQRLLERLLDAGLLEPDRAEVRIRWLERWKLGQLSAHVAAAQRAWAYYRGSARSEHLEGVPPPADLLDGHVSHLTFLAYPAIADGLVASAEWVLRDELGFKPLVGEDGTLYFHASDQGMEIRWARGPRGQAMVVGVEAGPR